MHEMPTFDPASENVMLLEQPLEGVAIEILVLGYHLDHTGQVGKQIALIPVCENSRYGSVVELDVFVMHLDKMDNGVCADQR